MQENDNVAIVRKLLEAHNKRNFEQVLKDHVSDQLEITSCAFPETLRGIEGFKQYFQNWDTAVPGSKVEMVRALPSGDCVILEAKGSGIHQGDFKSPYGVLPGTGRKIELRFCDVLEFKDGKLISLRNYSDTATLFDQAGMVWDFAKIKKKQAA